MHFEAQSTDNMTREEQLRSVYVGLKRVIEELNAIENDTFGPR